MIEARTVGSICAPVDKQNSNTLFPGRNLLFGVQQEHLEGRFPAMALDHPEKGHPQTKTRLAIEKVEATGLSAFVLAPVPWSTCQMLMLFF